MSSRPVTLHTEHIHSTRDSCRVDLSHYIQNICIHSSRDSCRVDLSPYMENTYILPGIVVESTCHPTHRTHSLYSRRDNFLVDLSSHIQKTYIPPGIFVDSTCHPTYRTHSLHSRREFSSRPVTPHTEHIHSSRDSCRVDLSPYMENTYILSGIVANRRVTLHTERIAGILAEIVFESTCYPKYRKLTFHQV